MTGQHKRGRLRGQPAGDRDLTELLTCGRPGWDGTTIPFAGAPIAGVPDDSAVIAIYPARPPVPVPPRPPQPSAAPQPPAGGPAPVEASMRAGWAHIFTIRCEYDQAPHPTPIRCAETWHDAAAGTFPALKHSAWAAGWRTDDWGRWACPAHTAAACYRTRYPAAIYAAGVHDARQAGDQTAVLWLTAAAEHGLIQRTRAHRTASHGKHTAVTQ